jgi:hypothetical protein
VQHPACRAIRSRESRLPEHLPDRVVRFAQGCIACRGHSKTCQAPVGLALEFVQGRNRWIQCAPVLRLG